MSRSFHSCITLLGADFVAEVARQQFAELDLPAALRARCVARFADQSLEPHSGTLRLYLLAELGAHKFGWPRLDYWRDFFERLGVGRPYVWPRGLFPVEQRQTAPAGTRDDPPPSTLLPVLSLQEQEPARPAHHRRPVADRRMLNLRLEERHHAAQVGLLQHYIQSICYAERDRRQIANLGAEPCLLLSKDTAEQKVEKLWIDGKIDDPAMWRAGPPLFPGHRGTLRPLSVRKGLDRQAARAAAHPIWYVNA
jgi:hypothetical protein